MGTIWHVTVRRMFDLTPTPFSAQSRWRHLLVVFLFLLCCFLLSIYPFCAHWWKRRAKIIDKSNRRFPAWVLYGRRRGESQTVLPLAANGTKWGHGGSQGWSGAIIFGIKACLKSINSIAEGGAVGWLHWAQMFIFYQKNSSFLFEFQCSEVSWEASRPRLRRAQGAGDAQGGPEEAGRASNLNFIKHLDFPHLLISSLFMFKKLVLSVNSLIPI